MTLNFIGKLLAVTLIFSFSGCEDSPEQKRRNEWKRVEEEELKSRQEVYDAMVEYLKQENPRPIPYGY